jgi:hypothetical protein
MSKSPRGLALRKYRKEEKQVYHKNNRVYRGNGPKGSGHQAGESWGEAKKIDPESKVRVYSKRGRSPSFDQGVRNYKQKAYNKALSEAKVTQFFNKEKIKQALG